MPRRPAKVTQADIARALRAIGQTGTLMAVEIASDGTIRLIPVEALAPPGPQDDHLVPEREIVL